MGRALRAPGELRRPRSKKLGPTPPLASTLTSDRHSVRHTAGRLDLLASLGLSLTLGRPPWGSSQGVWCRNAGDCGPPIPSAGLTLLPCHHPGC